MDTKEFLKLMPKEVVTNNDVKSKVEENEDFIELIYDFIEMFSIRRYTTLETMNLDQSIKLFNAMLNEGFVIAENPLYYNGVALVDFNSLLEEMSIDPEYVGNYLLEQTLKGEIDNLLDRKTRLNDMSFKEVLERFTLTNDDMPMGDMPALLLLFALQKSLVAKHLAYMNLKTLRSHETEDKEIFKILPILS